MSCVCTWEWNSKMRGCQQHIRFLTPVLTRTCFERSHSGFVKCLYMSLLSLLLICFSNCWGGLFYLGFTYLSMRGHSVHCFTFQFCLYPSVVAFLLLDVRWYVGGIFPKWIFSQVLERWFFFFFVNQVTTNLWDACQLCFIVFYLPDFVHLQNHTVPVC